MTFNPEQCAIAARRLAAKMVADQQVPLMLSFVGLSGDVDVDVERLDDGDAAIVVVARGRGAMELHAWATRGGVSSVELERPPS